MITKLDAALLKLEGALDYTTDPQVRALIDVAQQAIEDAKRLMEERPQEVEKKVACMGGYQLAA
jgi:hypothetical protein